MKSFWNSTRKWLPGVIVSLVILFIILKFVNLQKFINAIRAANYWLLLAVFIISIAWLVVRASVWHFLLAEKASFRDVFLSINEGYLLNNFLPFRLGEIGKAFLLSRKSELPFMEVFPTVVIERILDIAFAALILLSAVPFVVGAGEAVNVSLIMGFLVILVIFSLFLLTKNRKAVLKISERISLRRPIFVKFQDKLLVPFLSSLEVLTEWRIFIKVILWMIFNWVIAIFQFYLLLLAFFPNARPEWALFSLGAVAFGNAIPSLPGAVGTFEGALTASLTLLSGDESISFAAAIVAHLFNYVASGIIGLYAFSREGETIMGVYRQLRYRGEKSENEKP